jgi:prepilin signal peptidase PulO-like enzyme (type II secretory pathway)
MSISSRYPMVELLTALVFGLFAWHFGWSAVLPAFLYLGAIGVALAMIDLDMRRLLDALTLPSYVVAIVLLSLPAIANGTNGAWLRAIAGGLALLLTYFVLQYLAAWLCARAVLEVDPLLHPALAILATIAIVMVILSAIANGANGEWLRALAGGLALFLFYFLLWLIYPAGMGFGDVKLAGVLGLYLGFLGWGSVVIGGFLGFALGGLVGGGLMLARRAGRKSMIPFGPFMLAGAFLAVFWGEILAQAYLDQLGL